MAGVGVGRRTRSLPSSRFSRTVSSGGASYPGGGAAHLQERVLLIPSQPSVFWLDLFRKWWGGGEFRILLPRSVWTF
jgi:hypothetical protein